MYDGVPAHYYMQVQTYMAVTGAKKAIVFALFDDAWEVKTFEVSRNESVINRILKETKQFYHYHILMQIPPVAKASIDVDDVVEAVKLASTNTTRVEDTELNVLIAEYLSHDASAKEHSKKATEFKDKIIAKYLEGYKPADDMFTIKLSACKTTRFETTKFKEAHPELYAQFIAESEFTRFSVK
jgi:predicted phage-related endonuclease